jgi:hypothetical protein
MCREPALIPPVDGGSRAAEAAEAAAAVVWGRPPPELVRIEPQGAVTHHINHGAEAEMVMAMAILVHRIETTAMRP